MLSEFAASPGSPDIAAIVIANDARGAGLDFPELTGLATGVAGAAAFRADKTSKGHASVARRWIEWSTVWSPQLRASNVSLTLPLLAAAYVRARRAVPGCLPPPGPWPRSARHPPPGPFVEVASLDSEVSRLMGLLTTLNVPHQPYGGLLPKAVLRAIGALDAHHKSTKTPLFVWLLIQVFRRLRHFLLSSPDAMSGFAQLSTICTGLMRPGFGTGLTRGSVERLGPAFGLPALLIRWTGATKTHAQRLPASAGGPDGARIPVVTCVAHDLHRVTTFPFLDAIRSSELPPGSPLFPRCHRVPDSALASAHRRQLFTWQGGQLWEASSSHWSPTSLTRLARDLLTRAGFPGALPFASGAHAGKVGSATELERLGFETGTRDSLAQWATPDAPMRNHYECASIQAMAFASSCLGRLPLTTIDLGSISTGLPASLDFDRLRHHVRALGPVSVDDEPGSWVPAFVASHAGPLPARPPPPPPPPPNIPYAWEEVGTEEEDLIDEQEAIYLAATATSTGPDLTLTGLGLYAEAMAAAMPSPDALDW